MDKFGILYVGNKFWQEFDRMDCRVASIKYKPTVQHEFLKIVLGRRSNMLFIPLTYSDIRDITEEKLNDIIKEFLKYND